VQCPASFLACSPAPLDSRISLSQTPPTSADLIRPHLGLVNLIKTLLGQC